MVPADKTTNFHKLDAEYYHNLLDKSINKAYKIASLSTTLNVISAERRKSLGVDLTVLTVWQRKTVSSH